MKTSIFKINIEDYLHTIDQTFASKSQKDIYMTYTMIVAGIFAFAYSLFWDSSFEQFEKTRASVVSYEQRIQSDTNFLRQNPISKVEKLDNEIKGVYENVVIVKDHNAYIKSKIETISSLIYDERSWGDYLDSISRNAEKYKVKIKTLTNSYADNSEAFGHILNISISSKANYKNTLRFINSLEQSELVVDIHDINISASKSLLTDLNISVWGITY